MRPVFVIRHERPVEILSQLRELLRTDDAPCAGLVFRRHAVLHIRPPAQHFWSPHLYLEARLPDPEDEHAPSAPELRARFAPHPHVWTLFMAIYGVLTLTGLGGLMYGFSQWTLGWTPWALAIGPAALALIGFVYGAAFIGQGLGAQQMYELRSFVDRAADAA